MDNAGFVQVRERIAEHFQQQYGVPANAAQVVMSCGAAGGLNVVLKAVLDPADEVISFSPYFPEYLFYVDNHGGILRLVESDDNFHPDIDRLSAAVTPRTKVVIINTPNNPTGAVYPAPVIRGIAEVLNDAQKKWGRPIYLIADDIYRRIVYDEIAVPSIPAIYRNTIVVNSFSKDLSIAGERIGYIAFSPDVDDAADLSLACTSATRILGFVNAPALVQRVIAHCLDARIDVSEYQRNRDILCDAFGRVGFEVRKPGGAFYLFPRSPWPDDLECCEILRKVGIFVVPGTGFGRPGHVRIAYSVPHETCVRAGALLSSGI
jgi:aspartate aminotransferase